MTGIFNNLSSFSEFRIKSDIAGLEETLRNLYRIEGTDIWWFVANGRMFLVNSELDVLDNVSTCESFDCSGCTGLTSLTGAPSKIRGDFDCSRNNLTSLAGAPQEVGGDFDCYGNPNLSQQQIDDYKEFLNHPTPDQIDETGHYRPLR